MNIIVTNTIEKRLKEKEMNKIDLARELKTTKQAVDFICKSENMQIKTLLKVAYFLNCKPSDLYEYKIIVDNKNK